MQIFTGVIIDLIHQKIYVSFYIANGDSLWFSVLSGSLWFKKRKFALHQIPINDRSCNNYPLRAGAAGLSF